MLYIGIDLHGKQTTVCVRDEAGNVILRRQVSTRPEKVKEFLAQIRALGDGRYMVILEVCGFHDWLVVCLRADPGCVEVVLVQPEQASKKKTDRRDAARLSEVLWVNRQRLLAGERVHGVRRVYQPTDDERQDRQVTSVRQRLGRYRCFGCGSGGNALKLWAAVHRIGVYEAAIALCEALRIEVPWIKRW